MPMINDEMKSCIAECLRCYQTCLSTAMGHCLEIGGQHTGKLPKDGYLNGHPQFRQWDPTSRFTHGFSTGDDIGA
jgi:hypothetical protein